jgi:predicted AlkP superfamily phosphohydrolase/phosphomutase
MRAVIFGVDGLTFRILHPLIEHGKLPNFQRLRQEGCEAVLESKYPPITPAAWMSLATGLKPAGHGVYDFWEFEERRLDEDIRKAHVVTRRKGGKAIWNILSELGKRVLVLNVPLTYPPEPVNGIMVSGYMTPSSKVDFTYPAAFKEELYRAVPDYKIDLEKEDIFSVELTGKSEHLIQATLEMTQRRIELTAYLLKEQPWDFCFVTFVGADRLQHPLWEEISSLDEKATEYFRLLDHGLGLILDQLEPDDSLFVVSDHGFHAASRSFAINEFLYSRKLLALGTGLQQRREHSKHLSNLKHTMSRMGLLPLAQAVKRGLKVVNQVAQFEDVSQPLSADIAWEHTLACVPSHSSFAGGYANIFLASHLDAERLRELCEDLKNQVDPISGKPLLEAIYTTEVFGTGPYAPPEPHLLLLPTEGITMRTNLGNVRLWDDARLRHDPSKRCGVHHKDGVLYAYGGALKKGFQAPTAEIYDLVPTVLYSMGLPANQNFDGRILHELFLEPEFNEYSLNSVQNRANSDVVQRKLNRLLTL